MSKIKKDKNNVPTRIMNHGNTVLERGVLINEEQVKIYDTRYEPG